MITKICQQCGNEYQAYPSVKPKFCSKKCSNEAKQKGTWENCIQCGEKFWKFKSTPNKKYCCISCGITARNLTDKNPSYHRDLSGKNNPMYGKGFKGKNNPMYGKRKDKAPRWNGGRKIRKDGYVFVVAPDDHPYPAYTKKSGLKYILEHRLVMEKHIGRYLEPGEVVHHIDENPSNNDISNLKLFSSQSEHITTAH